MTSRKTIGLPLALAGALFAFAAPAAAQTSCGVTGQAQAPASVTYDPFSPNALQQISIPLTLTRFANGSAKTQSVSFILVQPPGGPAYQVVYNGTNILYPENATQGRPVQGSQTTGQVYYFFGGAGAPDQSNPLNLTVTVPANTDLSAGEPIRFDILYVCTGIGGLASVDTPARLTSAVRINVNVLSALQASYVGPALDFGDVGAKTQAQVATDPGPRTGNVRVASSGPFSVRMTSQNGYRLTYPGGNPALPEQSLRYRATFVGQTRDAANPAAIERVCARAGLTASGQLLPIQTTLLDGGVGRIAAPNYQDTLTVTVTPLVAPQTATSCAP
ncbi:MAG TPA: hypothetical protein VEZ20_10895 [Allosphingosinicella sp.]|jgi:hypothetical protein|nr:hypothetical protein [Allosphingosinicella sp.]